MLWVDALLVVNGTLLLQLVQVLQVDLGSLQGAPNYLKCTLQVFLVL